MRWLWRYCTEKLLGIADVRFGSKADMFTAKSDVRFSPESGHGAAGIGANIWLRFYAPAPK